MMHTNDPDPESGVWDFTCVNPLLIKGYHLVLIPFFGKDSLLCTLIKEKEMGFGRGQSRL